MNKSAARVLAQVDVNEGVRGFISFLEWKNREKIKGLIEGKVDKVSMMELDTEDFKSALEKSEKVNEFPARDLFTFEGEFVKLDPGFGKELMKHYQPSQKPEREQPFHERDLDKKIEEIKRKIQEVLHPWNKDGVRFDIPWSSSGKGIEVKDVSEKKEKIPLDAVDKIKGIVKTLGQGAFVAEEKEDGKVLVINYAPEFKPEELKRIRPHDYGEDSDKFERLDKESAFNLKKSLKVRLEDPEEINKQVVEFIKEVESKEVSVLDGKLKLQVTHSMFGGGRDATTGFFTFTLPPRIQVGKVGQAVIGDILKYVYPIAQKYNVRLIASGGFEGRDYILKFESTVGKEPEVQYNEQLIQGVKDAFDKHQEEFKKVLVPYGITPGEMTPTSIDPRERDGRFRIQILDTEDEKSLGEAADAVVNLHKKFLPKGVSAEYKTNYGKGDYSQEIRIEVNFKFRLPEEPEVPEWQFANKQSAFALKKADFVGAPGGLDNDKIKVGDTVEVMDLESNTTIVPGSKVLELDEVLGNDGDMHQAVRTEQSNDEWYNDEQYQLVKIGSKFSAFDLKKAELSNNQWETLRVKIREYFIEKGVPEYDLATKDILDIVEDVLLIKE